MSNGKRKLTAVLTVVNGVTSSRQTSGLSIEPMKSHDLAPRRSTCLHLLVGENPKFEI